MKKFLVLSLSLIFIMGCASVKVSRMESNELVDISGDWNDSDSQIVAKAIINECLGGAWRDDFIANQGRKPVVIVGAVKNRSQEHINMQTITKDFETELVNSGKVRFVASKDQRQELRDEKKDQVVHASAETKKAMHQETGADFMIQGQMNTIFDEYKGQSLKYYQMELELINIKTNEKVWIGQKKIKKLVKKRKYKA
jgi:uncharacterized protein (TIGR02722 family)